MTLFLEYGSHLLPLRHLTRE
uniref:Uncharacterized protein n=1 Tax=Rhizophora mucronata TaxID=61149 RepID=A0A2P2IVU7_RHIMU